MPTEIENLEKMLQRSEIYYKETISRLDKQIENNRQDFISYMSNHDKKHETESAKRTNELIKVYDNFSTFATKSDARIETILNNISEMNMDMAIKNEQMGTMQIDNSKRDKKFNKMVIMIGSGLFVIIGALLSVILDVF